MQKLLTFFFSKNISIFAIFTDQNFNDTLTNDIIILTNDIVSFEQLGPGFQFVYYFLQLLFLILLHKSVLMSLKTKINIVLILYGENTMAYRALDRKEYLSGEIRRIFVLIHQHKYSSYFSTKTLLDSTH